jgi:protein ImuA
MRITPRDSAEFKALQQSMQRIERNVFSGSQKRSPLTTGAAEVDAALPEGGLSRYGLHEVLAPPSRLSRNMATAGAVSGFVAGLAARAVNESDKPVLWCRPGHDLYAPGLVSYGLDPARVLLAHPRDATETLWAMEEGLRSGALAAVIGEVENPTQTAFRRLQLAAERGGVPGFILRVCAPERAAGPVATRWAIASAPSRPKQANATWLGQPRFSVDLLRARGTLPRHWEMEWTYDADNTSPTQGCFAVVSEIGDRTSLAKAEWGQQLRRTA